MGGDADYGRRLTAAERSEIRTRVSAGQTHWEAAEAVGCSTKTVQRLLVKTGGLPSRKRARSPLRLALAERAEISRGIRAGESFRTMARRLGRAPSTISREVRAQGSRNAYRAWRADKKAMESARCTKVPKLSRCPRLRAEVERRLAQRWSPQQISRRLAVDYPNDPEMRTSQKPPTAPCSSRLGALSAGS